MTVGFVAVHYPELAHFAAFVDRVEQAAAIMRPTPGCARAECWVSLDGEAVVSTGEWDSLDALEESFHHARSAGADFAFDERERRPRQIFRLRQP